ncbi:unnamed protein product [Coffea canephora]|uniref:Uncharacterized protein n=2 Tax=Coffea TaxID=13442 RepID=A0A068UGU4_COFCA|nr:uncharacterized protein LOC113712661 [Coffea arabica]CDP07497.1 unnamed protein product [Coffea canephora]
MGSLMAGWDSPVQDPKVEKLRRNSSLTREEIQAFWKSKKQKEEEHLRDISMLSPRSQENVFEDARMRNRRSDSLPAQDAKEEDLDPETASNLEKLILKHGWWISSNSAFLNEPPVIAGEGPRYKYASQFHVADMASSKTNNAAAPTGVGA